MKLTWRFLADLGERAGWTFVESYFTAWMMIPTLGGDTPGGFDTLFTANNLKFAAVAAAASIAKSVGVKKINNPNSASVLPPEAQPPAPVPAVEDEAPKPPPRLQLAVTPPIVAAVYSARLNVWDTVYLRPAPPGFGTFSLTAGAHNGLPVAELSPSGPLGPIGPEEQETMGLREPVAHPDAGGN